MNQPLASASAKAFFSCSIEYGSTVMRLVSCELGAGYQCYGAGSTEEYMRRRGLGVIHGGVNALRFTPTFDITSDEISLIVDGVRDALLNGPRIAVPQPAQAKAA